MPKSHATIRSMRSSDVESVVAIHLEAFQGFFLSELGERFLRELYVGILQDPSGIAFVYEKDGILVGFVAGSASPSGFYRRLLVKRWWRFGLASMGAVLRQPGIIPRLLRAFNTPNNPMPSEDCGTLMSIAVSPKIQGQGIGKELVKVFINESRQRGLKAVNLTTDKVNNDAVNKFYQRFGFRCFRTYFTPENREINEYLIGLEDKKILAGNEC
jgi:ribosomal protein S18 acetylase RimI-like enzyme